MSGLVRTLTLDEGVVLNGNIKITVIMVKGKQIKLRIEAPAEIKIDLIKGSDDGQTNEVQA